MPEKSLSKSSPEVATQVLQHPDKIGSVTFEWNGDRFSYTVMLADQQLSTPSDSGPPSWPDTPPIQQLSIESIDDRPVALGVGCAGTSHWSLSIESVEDGFRFDWACRAKELPEQLGSGYRRRSTEFGGPKGFSIEPNEMSQLISDSPDHLRVHPAAPLTAASTHRWGYCIKKPTAT